jgi:hypothetical protein
MMGGCVIRFEFDSAAMESFGVSPANGVRFVSISYNTTPRL